MHTTLGESTGTKPNVDSMASSSNSSRSDFWLEIQVSGWQNFSTFLKVAATLETAGTVPNRTFQRMQPLGQSLTAPAASYQRHHPSWVVVKEWSIMRQTRGQRRIGSYYVIRLIYWRVGRFNFGRWSQRIAVDQHRKQRVGEVGALWQQVSSHRLWLLGN